MIFAILYLVSFIIAFSAIWILATYFTVRVSGFSECSFYHSRRREIGFKWSDFYEVGLYHTKFKCKGSRNYVRKEYFPFYRKTVYGEDRDRS